MGNLPFLLKLNAMRKTEPGSKTVIQQINRGS